MNIRILFKQVLMYLVINNPSELIADIGKRPNLDFKPVQYCGHEGIYYTKMDIRIIKVAQ